ncbi:TetR/AcrR family transcriptional regulator [Aneurinibacillus sp. Ricciae_BoGa-3]|uniref:TetR/AcrR family transcriptional regulator n=1 Tax=Aneurinibacillus sp. Ricciae_BoGa-3 TaxID=3022697 RepID=UPI0023417681|nr:TetR/AcrR family transcriptional regulator [Aneurinibacillus sp. Ricciae_BoGa-3]WCK55684.1 TetR/AcrR family transcriptional regulator [Aneurinibacillus sp. Ricciae_BoGa-3]
MVIHNDNPSFQLLVSTTEELIQEKGCRQTTLQEIINRSGLSKGAIYHYVRSKDELFALILQEKIEEINASFLQTVEKAQCGDLLNPLSAISSGLFQQAAKAQSVTNQIFIYLLSQQDKPEIKEILHNVFEYSIQTSMRWLNIGKQGGAISESLDVKKTAIFLMVMTYGLRVVNSLSSLSEEFGEEDLLAMMARVIGGLD